MVLNLKMCSTLVSVMNLGEPGPLGVAMQGYEFGQALGELYQIAKHMQKQRDVFVFSNSFRYLVQIFLDFACFFLDFSHFRFQLLDFQLFFFWTFHMCF